MSWKSKKLGDILEIQNGYAFDSKLFSFENGKPLIRIRDIKNGIKTEVNYIGDFDSKYVVTQGDFLIGMDGEFACYEWKGDDALLNQRVCRLHNFKDDISPKFLFYGINNYLKSIEDNTSFTTVKHISSKQIANIEFPLPPLSEQKKIIEKLDLIFSELEKLVVATELSSKNAEALFQNYLKEVFEHGAEGWVSMTLGNLCEELFAGGDVPKARMSKFKTSEFFVPIFTNGEKNKGLYGFTDKARVNRPSITISARGTIGYSEVRYESFYPAIRLIVTTPNLDIVELDYLKHAINSLKILHSGASIPQLTVPMIKDYLIKLPKSKDTQKLIVENLNILRFETDRLKMTTQKKMHLLSNLKQSALSKAFSGELIKE